MDYHDLLRKTIKELLPKLDVSYNDFEEIKKGKKNIKEIKGFQHEDSLFLTTVGKSLDERIRECLLEVIFPPAGPMFKEYKKQDNFSTLSALIIFLSSLSTENMRLNEDELLKSVKNAILEVSGMIEEYYKQIILKGLVKEERRETSQMINQIGLSSKENRVLKKLKVQTILFEEFSIEDTIYYHLYDHFINDSNRVHSIENPTVATDFTTLLKEIENNFSNQFNKQNIIKKLVSGNSVKYFFPKQVAIHYFIFFRISFFLSILDHCFDCWNQYFYDFEIRSPDTNGKGRLKLN